MFLNIEFTGDFIQGMADMLIPAAPQDDEPEDDEALSDTPLFPKPGDDGDRDEEDAEAEDRMNRLFIETTDEAMAELRADQERAKPYPGGE